MHTLCWTIAAGLALAACGTTTTPPGPGPGPGSGPGPCENNCTVDGLTLDQTGFYDDGTRWWTTDSGPTLHGTIADGAGATLQAMIDGAPAGEPAAIEGQAWTIVLPDGAIAQDDTTVVLRLTRTTDADADAAELRQAFALDDQMPAISIVGGAVRDERGDAIDTTGGEPVHVHDGPSVDLAAPGCPAVYKYAYLLDQHDPMYGRQTTPNPLAWQLAMQEPAGVDPSASAYRVRDDADHVVLDWTPIAPDASGVYSIALYRDGDHPIPELGTHAGQFHLDVRARDHFGHETVFTTCWDHHPLAAPLAVQPLAPAADGLFAMSLPDDAAISRVISGGAITEVLSQTLVQQTAEPVTVTLAVPTPTGHWSKTYAVDTVATGTTSLTPTISCGSPGAPSADPRCDTSAVPDPADPATAGALATPDWLAAIVDASTGQAVCLSIGPSTTCTLPPRQPGEAPHAYRAVVKVGGITELMPPNDPGQFVAEYAVLGRTYTGMAPTDAGVRCSHLVPHVIHGTPVSICEETTQYMGIVALDRARIDFDPIHVNLSTSPDPAVAPAALAYRTDGGAEVTLPLTWDAGVDVLPGQ